MIADAVAQTSQKSCCLNLVATIATYINNTPMQEPHLKSMAIA